MALTKTCHRYWGTCTFTHLDSGRSCGIKYSEEVGDVSLANCSEFESDFEYLGDWTSYSCGLRLKDMSNKEEGKWRCTLESLAYTQNGRADGAEDFKDFSLTFDYEDYCDRYGTWLYSIPNYCRGITC